MSPKGGEMFQIESVRLSINEHMASVREEISCVVNERLSSVEQFMFNLFQREMETLVETLLERRDKLLDVMLQPHGRVRPLDGNASGEDYLRLPVYRHEVSPEQQEYVVLEEEEPERLTIKEEEEEEPLQGPEETHVSTMTLLAVKTEADDDAEPVAGTAEPAAGTAEPVAGTTEPVAGTAEPVAGTSAEHVNAQPRAEDWGVSRPTSDDELIFALCASDSGEEEAMSDDWVETIEGRTALKTLKSREGVGPGPSSNSPSQPLHPKPPKNSHSPPSSGGGSSSSQAEKKIFTCKVCGKSCTHKGHLNYHMRSHTGEKPFACAVCGKSFGQRCHLRDHMSKHTGEKRFACKACGKGWSKKWFLKYHTCTGISPIPHIKEEPEDLFQRAPVEESTTTSLAAVKVEEVDGDETRESDRRSPLVSSRPAKTQDVIAQARGTSRPTGGGDDDLLLLTWHGSETGVEEGCNEWRRGETSGFLTALSPSNSHKRPTHWDANFLQATHSAMMMTATSHAGERSFMCTVCGKNCSHQGHLNYHMNTHTGQKPFTCTLCGKGFGQKGNLKEHMVKHTNIKPFTCKVCGKGCSRKADLKVHMMIHTGEKPFICTVCGKGCSHRGHLNYHMRSHTGEKPFTCPVCGRGFIQRSNMKVHMVKHTRERLLQGSRPELSLTGDAPVSNSSSM